jgi:hypothetical protein
MDKTEWLHLRVTPDDKRALLAIAVRDELSMSQVVRTLIRDEIRRYKRRVRKERTTT